MSNCSNLDVTKIDILDETPGTCSAHNMYVTVKAAKDSNK